VENVAQAGASARLTVGGIGRTTQRKRRLW